MSYKEHKFWNKEKLWDLRQEICLGSLFLNDYENSFGIPKEICSYFFECFIMYYFMIEEEKENGLTDILDVYCKYNNADDLWNYFCGIEDPFGELEKKSCLRQMCQKFFV